MSARRMTHVACGRRIFYDDMKSFDTEYGVWRDVDVLGNKPCARASMSQSPSLVCSTQNDI